MHALYDLAVLETRLNKTKWGRIEKFIFVKKIRSTLNKIIVFELDSYFMFTWFVLHKQIKNNNFSFNNVI